MASFAWLVAVPALLAVYFTTMVAGASYALFAVILGTGWLAIAQGLQARGVRVPAAPTLIYFAIFIWLAATTFHAAFVLPGYGSEPQFKALAAVAISSTVFLLAPQFLRTTIELERFFRVLHMSGVVIAASVWLGIAGVGFGEVLEFRTGEVRAFGPLGDQVGFALALFALLALARRSWTVLVFQIGALLVLIVGIAVVALQEKGSGMGVRALGRMLWILAGAAMLIGVLLLTPVGQDFLSRVVEPDRLFATLAQRAGSLVLGFDMVVDRPLLGAGFNGFAAMAWEYDPRLYFVVFRPAFVSNAGNQWVQLGAEGGVMAIALVAAFVVVMVRRQWLAARDAAPEVAPGLRAATAWSLAFVVANQGACWLMPNSLPSFYWFLLFGVANAALAISRPAASAANVT